MPSPARAEGSNYARRKRGVHPALLLACILPAVLPHLAHSRQSRSIAGLPGAGSLRVTRISPPHCGQLCATGGALEKSERAMVSPCERRLVRKICNSPERAGKLSANRRTAWPSRCRWPCRNPSAPHICRVARRSPCPCPSSTTRRLRQSRRRSPRSSRRLSSAWAGNQR